MQWSRERKTIFARPSPRPWYMQDMAYRVTMVPPYTATEATFMGVFSQNTSSSARAAMARRAETPWDTEENISSPREYLGRPMLSQRCRRSWARAWRVFPVSLIVFSIWHAPFICTVIYSFKNPI